MPADINEANKCAKQIPPLDAKNGDNYLIIAQQLLMALDENCRPSIHVKKRE